MALHLVTGYKGAAHITAADQGAFNAGVFGNESYVLPTGQEFALTVISNNTIRIADGDMVIQGRHVSLKKDTYEEVTIANGLQGMNRNDLIVVRYTKDSTTGIENAQFVVIQGVSTDGTASDPSYTTGDILSGECLLHEEPLYRIPLSGLNVGTPVALFTKGNNMTDIPEVTNATNIATAGKALDARQANPSVAGSMAAQIATNTTNIAKLSNVLTGTLTAGATSLTISDSSITTDSMIDIYTNVYGVNPTEVTVASGSITLVLDAQDSDVSVKVKVM